MKTVLVLLLALSCWAEEGPAVGATIVVPDVYLKDMERLEDLPAVMDVIDRAALERYLAFAGVLEKLPPDYVLSFFLLSDLRKRGGSEVATDKRLELLAAIMRKDTATSTHILDWDDTQDLQGVTRKPMVHVEGPLRAYRMMVSHYVDLKSGDH